MEGESSKVDTLRIDMTSLSAFSICKRKGILSGVHHLQTAVDAIPLRAGKAIHLAVETRMKGSSDQEALTAFDLDYKDYSEKVVYEDNPRRWSNLRKILEVWLGNFPSHPYKIPSPSFVEIGFSLALTDWLTIVGKPDALVLYNGGWWVLDTKTTGKFDWKFRKKWETSGQISCYMYALQQHLKAIGDSRPVVGAIINAIEIKDIPESNLPCRAKPQHLGEDGKPSRFSECGAKHLTQELIQVNRTQKELEDWKNAVVHDAEQFLKFRTNFPSLSDVPNIPGNGIMSDACSSCKYREWCFGGLNPKMLPHMFEVDKWEPYPGALYELQPTP